MAATPIYRRFVLADKLEETLHGFDGFHPLGRTGTACDLANTITFLLFPAVGWVTGAIWNVGGDGMSGRNHQPGTCHLRRGRKAGHNDHGRTR